MEAEETHAENGGGKRVLKEGKQDKKPNILCPALEGMLSAGGFFTVIFMCLCHKMFYRARKSCLFLPFRVISLVEAC